MTANRLAIVASHVIQYQDPFFRLLAKEVDLTVLYCSDQGARPFHDEDMGTTLSWDLEMLQGYRHVFLRNFARNEYSGFLRHVNPGIVPALIRGKYDAAIFMLGWGSFTAILGILTCRAAGIPFFLYGDSSHPLPDDSIRRHLRKGALRTIFRLAGGFMVSGVLNAEYYRHYGADPRRFFSLPWAMDNDRFVAACAMTSEEREALRGRHGIGREDVVFVSSGKLIERKDPLTIVRALRAMRHGQHAKVIFLGDGPLRAAIENEADDRIRLLGFINQTDLPRHYAMGDVFVLASQREPRGTVINEAMACGLPLVISDRNGCIGDIVQPGDNALIFPAGDARSLAKAFDRLAADPELRARMGCRSREIIDKWDYSAGVRGVREMLASLEHQR